MSLSKYKSDLLVLVHFCAGIIVGKIPSIVFYWEIGVFLLAILWAFNVTGSARNIFMLAGYLIGMELLIRMAGTPLPHEFTKYAVSFLLLLSLLLKSKQIPIIWVVFGALLMPGILLTDAGDFEASRQLISANLAGPFCLLLSVAYFHNRVLRMSDLRQAFLYTLYPLASILGYLFIATPDLSEIDFGYRSNFATSVYGPNQVSSILGLGILLIGISYFLKLRLFSNHLLSFSFLGFLLFRGLLTFSRGGMLAAILILLLVFIYLSVISIGTKRAFFRTVAFAFGVTLCAYFAFNYTNELTDNKLYDRYTGQKAGKQIEDIDKFTSGRTLIVNLDWQIFLNNPVLGVGVGMGKFYRTNFGFNVFVAAHNEFSRLLAEHGLFGLIALVILIVAPLLRFFESTLIVERVLIIASVGFCFAFMTHSATRIAAPCFFYGMAFIKLYAQRHVAKDANGFVNHHYSVYPSNDNLRRQ
jgi:O-antigen ligase